MGLCRSEGPIFPLRQRRLGPPLGRPSHQLGSEVASDALRRSREPFPTRLGRSGLGNLLAFEVCGLEIVGIRWKSDPASRPAESSVLCPITGWEPAGTTHVGTDWNGGRLIVGAVGGCASVGYDVQRNEAPPSDERPQGA